MILLISLLALSAALMFLASGYLIGIRKGDAARENLRLLNRGFAKEIAHLRQLSMTPKSGDDGLRATLQDILSPLVHRERLSYELSRLEGGVGHQRDLTAILDQMADKGNFSSVLLTDAQGWRVAASSATQESERLGATASLLLLMADRIASSGSPAPLSLMLYDTTNTTTLCRIFQVDSHRMTLTVVASGADLTPAAIDPALVKLNAVLLSKDAVAAP
jgi:hypothetical protein